jgi:hypothetical protein
VDIAINFTGTAEDNGYIVLAAEFQDVEGHGDVIQSTMGLLHKFMHFSMSSEMNHCIQVRWICGVTQTPLEIRKRRAQILE